MSEELPKKMYVCRDGEGEDEYLLASEKMSDLVNQQKRTVGEYELVKTYRARLRVTSRMIKQEIDKEDEE